MPKIDFAFYKARLPNPALADQFQKAVSLLLWIIMDHVCDSDADMFEGHHKVHLL